MFNMNKLFLLFFFIPSYFFSQRSFTFFDEKTKKDPESVHDLIILQDQANSVKIKIPTSSPEDKQKYSQQLEEIEANIRRGLNIYNTQFKRGLGKELSTDDITELISIHKNCIKTILVQASTEKGILGKMRMFFHTEEKEKIIKGKVLIRGNGIPVGSAFDISFGDDNKAHLVELQSPRKDHLFLGSLVEEGLKGLKDFVSKNNFE